MDQSETRVTEMMMDSVDCFEENMVIAGRPSCHFTYSRFLGSCLCEACASEAAEEGLLVRVETIG